MKGLYKVIRNLISEEEAYEISQVIKKQPPNDGDAQVKKSNSYYQLPICNILLGQLVEKVSEVSGKKLKPTYSYCRVCFKGADLKPHKDRPSCEYSITLNLSQTHEWPIYMGKRKILQRPGDGVLYKGCEIEHSRPEFTGDEYIQVFLHYVDSDGPYKDYVYDIKKQPETQMYRFIFQDGFQHHTDYFTFQDVITNETIDSLRTILDNKQLEEAQVGDNGGEVNKMKRRSKVFWLPKTDEFVEIYKIFHGLVGKCNDDFFKFRLSEISEYIQYTVYESSDEGYYDWHLDMGPEKAKRKLSLVCQLSEPSEYEGGELQIHTGQIRAVEKKKGLVVIFPSYLLHCVTPVTRGKRQTLVLWIEGPAFI